MKLEVHIPPPERGRPAPGEIVVVPFTGRVELELDKAGSWKVAVVSFGEILPMPKVAELFVVTNAENVAFVVGER